jgi:hypothetical protein
VAFESALADVDPAADGVDANGARAADELRPGHHQGPFFLDHDRGIKMAMVFLGREGKPALVELQRAFLDQDAGID